MVKNTGWWKPGNRLARTATRRSSRRRGRRIPIITRPDRADRTRSSIQRKWDTRPLVFLLSSSRAAKLNQNPIDGHARSAHPQQPQSDSSE
jgi:hypothetical protein